MTACTAFMSAPAIRNETSTGSRERTDGSAQVDAGQSLHRAIVLDAPDNLNEGVGDAHILWHLSGCTRKDDSSASILTRERCTPI